MTAPLDFSECGTDDRSLWPAEAVELAESCGLPDHVLFYRVVEWPYKTPYDDYMDLPRQPRGERSFRWIPSKVTVGARPNQRVFLFAQKWKERDVVIEAGRTHKRDVFIPRRDPMEKQERSA